MVLVSSVAGKTVHVARTAKLALVAKGERKRWIIATENMQLGDLVKSTTDTTISSCRHYDSIR